MEKHKKKDEKNINEESCAEKQQGCSCGQEHQQEEEQSGEAEALKKQLEEKTKQSEEYLSLAQRTAAEFDNYKKRTAREKEALYSEAVSDAVSAFLPVIDNLERAMQAANKDEEGKSLKEGIDMVVRQVKDVMKNLGVEEIQSVGASFDPQIHNAVMHIEDESHGENTVIEEFQKGYIINGRVIRHSMVKVAN